MEEAQEDLGISPNEYLPIVYTTELSWQQASTTLSRHRGHQCINWFWLLIFESCH